MTRLVPMMLASLLFVSPCLVRAADTQFKAGALIIPMDTTYQQDGILTAFGLLYQLLLADVPIHWVIKAKKTLGDTDFTASAKDFVTGAAVTSHGYRGGPFVIEDTWATKASTVITSWLVKFPKTTVHTATAQFLGRTGRLLTAAPTIAVIADKNEDIAFDYLNAAGIPDSKGQAWPAAKLGSYAAYPDVLSITEIAGSTTTSHSDGALFRTSGQPAFCQVMTMHWGVNEVVDEVVAEYRAFLGFPTHVFAECQAVNAIEDNQYGHFLTTKGLDIDKNGSNTLFYLNADTPFAQLDGAFSRVGGSEPAYALASGSLYYDSNVVMITANTATIGSTDIWMTGYLDGLCSIREDALTCTKPVGKISYLGGHEYETKTPVTSAASKTQGTRLFLNSLFEASCTTLEGQPIVSLTKTGPAWTTSDTVTYTLTYANLGKGPALDITITDTLPAGATFVSCTGSCTHQGGVVTWTIGDLAANATGSMTLTVKLASLGTYLNSSSASFRVGNSKKSAASLPWSVTYLANTPDGWPNPDFTGPWDGGLSESGIPAGDGGLTSESGIPAGDGGLSESGIPAGDGGLSESGIPAGDGSGQDTGASLESGGSSFDAGPDGSQGSGGSGSDSGCDCTMGQVQSTPSLPHLMLLAGLCLALRRRRR